MTLGQVVLGVLPAASPARAQMDTRFTFQGQLRQYGVPVSGQADLVFRLFDAETDGNQIGSQSAGADFQVNPLMGRHR